MTHNQQLRQRKMLLSIRPSIFYPTVNFCLLLQLIVLKVFMRYTRRANLFDRYRAVKGASWSSRRFDDDDDEAARTSVIHREQEYRPALAFLRLFLMPPETGTPANFVANFASEPISYVYTETDFYPDIKTGATEKCFGVTKTAGLFVSPK